MDTKLTIRQIMFLFLFLSIGSIFNYIPNLAANNAGGTGYIAILYSCIILIIYAILITQILRIYPDSNIYDVLKKTIGTGFAKAIIFLYAIWAYFFVVMKTGAYSITLQATLMPSIHPGILLTILFLLVLYTLSKNERTIFRFAEFLFQPVILFLVILFLFALPDFNFRWLVPVSIVDLEDNLYTIGDICSIGGNLVLVLFFCKQLRYSGNQQYIRKRILRTVVDFSIISLLAFIMSVCVNGPNSTSGLSYPIFQAAKSVSILNTFERFDALLTMISMMSDFVSIVVFMQLTMLCLGWVFESNKQNEAILQTENSQSLNMNNNLKVYGITLFFISCTYILLTDMTQYDFESLYRGLQVYVNLAFQFIIPVLLGIVCLIKHCVESKRESKVVEL